MKLLKAKGATAQRARFLVKSQSTGLGVPGLAYNSAGLSVYYHRSGDAASTAVPLAAGTLGTWSAGGFSLVDNTNMPGLCELGLPDACWAAGDPIIYINVPSGDFCEPLEYELTGADFTAAAGAANALLSFGAGAGQISPDGTGKVHAADLAGVTFPANFGALGITAAGKLSEVVLVDTMTTYTGNTPQTGDAFARLGAPAGASIAADIQTRSTFAGGAVASVTAPVTVGTNNDKAGYALAQAFPANFAALAITAAGAVTAGTVTDAAMTTAASNIAKVLASIVASANAGTVVAGSTAALVTVSGLTAPLAALNTGTAWAVLADGVSGAFKARAAIPAGAASPSGANVAIAFNAPAFPVAPAAGDALTVE